MAKTAQATSVFALIVVFLSACGDDGMMTTDTGTPIDTGMPVDTAVPTDTSGPGTSRTVMLRFVDQDEAPLGGVKFAIDTDLGRFEDESDAAGELVLPFRYMEDSLDSIAALEGYRIIARVGQAYQEPDAADGYGEVVLPALDPDMGDTIRLIAGATGVPTGGRFCVGVLGFFQVCQDEGTTWDQRVRVGQIETIQDYVYGYAFDDTGALYDFARADWSATTGDRTVTVAFDGTFEETPVERDVTINYPADPESPFRTETLDETWQGWMVAAEPGTYLTRSALTMVSAGTDSITMRVHTFPVMGDELIWAAAPYARLSEGARSFTWYSGEPPTGPIDILDLARVRSGAMWTDEFEWTAPATDVDNYFALFTNNAGIIVIGLGTPNEFATVPPLPTGYDPMVAFPFPGAPGELQVIAVRGDLPPDEMATDPYRVDATASYSLQHPITF